MRPRISRRRHTFTFAAACAAAAVMATSGVAVAAPSSSEPAYPYQGQVVGAPQGLKVRNATNTKGVVLGSLPNGSHVDIDCSAQGQKINGNPLWYLIYSEQPGDLRWVSARYVTNVGPAPAPCAVSDAPYQGQVVDTPKELRVRNTVNVYGDVLAKLPKGTQVTIACSTKGQTILGNSTWYLLKAGQPGTLWWVSARYVTNLGPAPEPCTAVT